MRIAVLWGLLVLLYQQTLVSSHTLGRPASDLAQLKGLLERFEETLSEAGQEGDLETDYEANDQELGQISRELNLDQERDREPFVRERPQSAESLSRTASQRNHLLDLLMSKRRAASCFGARMDRIGNAGGLGCNNGKG